MRERGISVQVASLAEPDRWMELGFLWYSLSGNRPEPELDGWAWFSRDHLPASLWTHSDPDIPKPIKRTGRRKRQADEILAADRADQRSRRRPWEGRSRWSIAGALILTAAALLLWSLSR